MKKYASRLGFVLLTLGFLVSCGAEKPVAKGSAIQNVPEPSQALVLRSSFSFAEKPAVEKPSFASAPVIPHLVLNADYTIDEASATCLQCHGPTFDDLAARTADYIEPWGENVNPHMFVDVNRANPHDSTSVPSCLRCHAEHTIPLSAPVRQANLRYCYNCHHTEEFISCNSCHE